MGTLSLLAYVGNFCRLHFCADKPGAMSLRKRRHDVLRFPSLNTILIRRILLSEPCTIIFRMCSSGLSYGVSQCVFVISSIVRHVRLICVYKLLTYLLTYLLSSSTPSLLNLSKLRWRSPNTCAGMWRCQSATVAQWQSLQSPQHVLHQHRHHDNRIVMSPGRWRKESVIIELYQVLKPQVQVQVLSLQLQVPTSQVQVLEVQVLRYKLQVWVQVHRFRWKYWSPLQL